MEIVTSPLPTTDKVGIDWLIDWLSECNLSPSREDMYSLMAVLKHALVSAWCKLLPRHLPLLSRWAGRWVGSNSQPALAHGYPLAPCPSLYRQVRPTDGAMLRLMAPASVSSRPFLSAPVCITTSYCQSRTSCCQARTSCCQAQTSYCWI
jgi:hypothetical protein